jgi:aspartyl-tRNA synthetase
MSFLKKPFKKLGEKLGSSNDKNASDSDSVPSKTEGVSSGSSANGANTPLNNGNGNGNTATESKRQSREIIAADKKRRSMDKARTKAENKKRESMARIEDEQFLREGPPALTKLYKPFSMNMSKRWDQEKRILFKELDFKSKFSASFHL